MSSGPFTKLFSTITDSTVWCESHATRIVWITMLAIADRRGLVRASVPGLAHRARVTLEECEHALRRFQEPDTYSRTKEHDGRRVEPIDGGWRLLNYGKYREARDYEDRLAYQREWDRKERLRDPTSSDISDISDQSDHEPTHAEADIDTTKTCPPSGAFMSFWSAWPKGDRKQSRGVCYKVWKRGGFDKTADEILAHVAVMKATSGWRQGYIPAPLVYLNQRRWEGAEQQGAQERRVAL